MSYVIPSGKFRLISAIVFFTFSDTSIAFMPGSILMSITAAFSPSMPLSVLYEEDSSAMSATSLNLNMDPSLSALMTISSNSDTVDRRPCATIGIVTSMPEIGC